MVYGWYLYTSRFYKPTYNWGGTTLYDVDKPGGVIVLPLVPSFIKHGWLENPRNEWRFHRKITYFYGPFSSQPCLITGEFFHFHDVIDIYLGMFVMLGFE